MQNYKPEVVDVLEPKVSGERADGVIRKLNFNYSFRVEADGFKGVIWLMWKKEGAVEVLNYNLQFIHLKY